MPSETGFALATLSAPRGLDADSKKLSAFQSVATVQRKAEALWGVGQLQDYADVELRGRFASALKKFETALDSGSADDVQRRAKVLVKGWLALEQFALEAGKRPGVPENVWVWRSEQNKAYAIAQDDNARLSALVNLPKCTVWTLDEIGRILHYLTQADPLLGRIKEMFGAEVIEVVRGIEKKPIPKKEKFQSDKPEYDDDVPF